MTDNNIEAPVETVPEGTVVTSDNAGSVTTSDGVTHVGILPAEPEGVESEEAPVEFNKDNPATVTSPEELDEDDDSGDPEHASEAATAEADLDEVPDSPAVSLYQPTGQKWLGYVSLRRLARQSRKDS